MTTIIKITKHSGEIMSNPTITVVLSSLDEGTVPTVTGSIEAKEGEQINVQVTWPTNASDKITCDLDFSNSENQDPFNDVQGGDTTLHMTRPASDQAAVTTLLVENDATVTTDTYDLILTIDGVTYTKDPTIIIDSF
jgi:hypothetical protein